MLHLSPLNARTTQSAISSACSYTGTQMFSLLAISSLTPFSTRSLIHTASQSSPTQAYTQAINDLDKELENMKQAFEDEKNRYEERMKQGY